MVRDEAIVDWVCLRFEDSGFSIDIRIPNIFVEDVAAISSSVLGNLCVKLRDDL